MRYMRWLIPWLLLTLVGCSLTEAPSTSAPSVPTSAPPAATSAPAQSTSAPAAPETGGKMPTDPKLIQAQVQQALDKYLDIMNRGDEQALAKVVDQENLTFKRVQNDFMKSVYSWKGRNPKGTVSKVEVFKPPYVKVWLKESVRGEHIWVFKWTDQGWLLSEPDEEELGEKRTKETDKFIVRYFEWDEPLLPRIVAAVDKAYSNAVNKTGRTPKEKFQVRMAPTFQTFTGRSSIGTAASYNSSAKMLSLRSPESFGGTFSGLDAAESVVDIQHELTHLLVDEAIAPKGTLWWVNEAFAHYFTDDLRADTVRRSLQQKVFSLKDLNLLEVDRGVSADIQQQDLFMRAQGTVAVQYMVEKLGGRDKAWEWLIREAQDRDFDKSFKQVFGLSYDQFEKGWQEFMKQKYGG